MTLFTLDVVRCTYSCVRLRCVSKNSVTANRVNASRSLGRMVHLTGNLLGTTAWNPEAVLSELMLMLFFPDSRVAVRESSCVSAYGLLFFRPSGFLSV